MALIGDQPLQTSSKVGINFLNKISFNLLKTTPESKRFSVVLGGKQLKCHYFFTKIFCFLCCYKLHGISFKEIDFTGGLWWMVTFVRYHGKTRWKWAYTQQNSYSISHLLGTVTTKWLDSDSVVTVVNCWQHGDYTAIGSLLTVLLAVVNGDYTVTVQSLCSHCA